MISATTREQRETRDSLLLEGQHISRSMDVEPKINGAGGYTLGRAFLLYPQFSSKDQAGWFCSSAWTITQLLTDSREWTWPSDSKVGVFGQATCLGYQSLGPMFCMLHRGGGSQPTGMGTRPSRIFNSDCESQHRIWGLKLWWDISKTGSGHWVDKMVKAKLFSLFQGKHVAFYSVVGVSVLFMRPRDVHCPRTQWAPFQQEGAGRRGYLNEQ